MMKQRHKSTLAFSREWHEERLAEGPMGFIRERGAKTWDDLHSMCEKFVRDWESLSRPQRDLYAFPNPEDRRPIGPRRRG